MNEWFSPNDRDEYFLNFILINFYPAFLGQSRLKVANNYNLEHSIKTYKSILRPTQQF